MSKQSGGAKLIKQAKLIMWDEAPMANRHTIETVDRSFRYILDVKEPFGGKVMVSEMERIKLTRNMRARTDPTFNEFLLHIGNGEEPTLRDDLVLIPKKLVIENNGDSIGEDALISEIFSSLDENTSCAKYMTERAILASRNEYVDQLNETLISIFPGESRTFLSFDSAEDETNNYYQEDYLNTLTPSDLPVLSPSSLSLFDDITKPPNILI
ncbi:uncharacterized protein LOC132628883 [Lycium barbarum]|uniref:uncharacterized protein LOC132628883 n=1 Tax=Lycium barbarum TaxID=112863 RepID=UPI00293E4FD5|nr:uncharacterized protein LOC132628883 [Lycium barbarum]